MIISNVASMSQFTTDMMNINLIVFWSAIPELVALHHNVQNHKSAHILISAKTKFTRTSAENETMLFVLFLKSLRDAIYDFF